MERTSLQHTRRRKRRRHIWLIPLAVLLAAAVVGGVLCLVLKREPAPTSSDTPPDTSSVAAPVRKLPKEFIDRNTASPYILLMDVTNNRVLYSKAADSRCYPASLTKLMTAIVAVENVPEDTVFTVGNEISLIDPYSSRAYLTTGTRLTLEQLLQAMLLPSGNDAAYTLAVGTARLMAGNDQLDNKAALSAFCAKMNEKAQALGCSGTHYENPDGIHSAGHYTTATDIAKIAACALEKPLLASVVSTPSVNTTLLSGQTVKWTNSNKLLRPDNAFSYEGATGMKTGSTDEAGYCLVASATRDGQTSIAVVMGSKTESGRWEDAGGLLDMSFQ